MVIGYQNPTPLHEQAESLQEGAGAALAAAVAMPDEQLTPAVEAEVRAAAARALEQACSAYEQASISNLCPLCHTPSMSLQQMFVYVAWESCYFTEHSMQQSDAPNQIFFESVGSIGPPSSKIPKP